ncbi:MAG: PQQ-binding-like beta-propeller repeat protein [Halanaeroarchaeum sp.]
MRPTRRRLIRSLAGVAALGGIASLAGCSSSCPDRGRPTPTTTVSIRDDPTGGFGSTPAADWLGPHGNAANSGYSDRSLPPEGLSVRWRTELDLPATDSGGLSASAPTVARGGVVVADERRVHSLSLQKGETRWRSDAIRPTRLDSLERYRANTVAPALGPDGDVFVGTGDGLVALDGSDGATRWRVDALKEVARPAVVEGTVYAQDADTVVAVAMDGTETWRRSVGRRGTPSPPAVGANRVVAWTDAGLVGVDRVSGDVVWERELSVESQVVVDDGTCFVGNYEGLHALDCRTGEDRWTFSRDDYRALLTPVVTAETIYVVEQPGEAGAATFALDRGDGRPSPRWCSDIGSGAVTGATDEYVLTALPLGDGPDEAHSIVAFTTDFGEAPWAIRGGGDPASWVTSPAIVDGAVVLATRGGTVVAIGGER